MILIHIIPNDPAQVNEIIDMLVEDKLILNAMIQENLTVRQKNNHGKMESIKRSLILGKTKALLFNTIDEVLQQKFKDDMPILYSIPIVHMDWVQAEHLVQETSKV